MRQLAILLVLTLLVSGCSEDQLKLQTSSNAMCDTLAEPIDTLVAALLVDGGDQSIIAGDRLVAGFDAGC